MYTPHYIQRSRESGTVVCLAWLNQFRRLRVSYEKRPDIHEAFLRLGCILVESRTVMHARYNGNALTCRSLAT